MSESPYSAQLEVIDQVVQPQDAARLQHARDQGERHGLPEIRQVMQGVPGVHAGNQRLSVPIREQAVLHAGEISPALLPV
jgi:hypothetical protein